MPLCLFLRRMPLAAMTLNMSIVRVLIFCTFVVGEIQIWLCSFDPKTDKPVVMFVQPKDPKREIWTGIRPGVEGAKARDFGASEAYNFSDLGGQADATFADGY